MFKSEKTFHASPDLIPAVARAVIDRFRCDGFEVQEASLTSGGTDISITKGATFKAVIGLKSALKVKIVPASASSIHIEAGVGIFGQQAIPTAIAMLAFWPVLIPQIWGMVQQAKLDDLALDVAQQVVDSGAFLDTASQFCPHCGKPVSGSAKFCGECGGRV